MYHEKYLQELDVSPEVEAYDKTLRLRKTLELISLEKRRVFDQYERAKVVSEVIKELHKLKKHQRLYK